MTSRLPKPHLPKSRTDDLVETAFQATWTTLSSNPYRDRSKDDELKSCLRDKLTAMCSAGMVDTEMMRRIALECFNATSAA
jgi:hypothetical protein